MDQGVISAVNFLTGILLARFLGLVEFGIFTVAWLVIEFLQSIQHSLIIAPMMSIAPKHSADERPAYLGAVIVHQLCFSAVSFAALVSGMLTIGYFIPDWEFLDLMWPLAVAVTICPIQNFIRRYLFVVDRAGAAFYGDVARYIGQLTALVALFLLVKMDSGQTLWVIAGCAAVATIVCLSYLGEIAWSTAVVRQSFARQWAFSKWLLFAEIMRWTTGNLFVIASGAMIGAAAVGAIRAAQNLVGICHILVLGLENIVPIAAARRFGAGGRKALVSYLKRFSVLGGLATGSIVVIAAVAPEYWLNLVYVSEFAGFGYVVQWWAVIYFLTFFNLTPTFGLRAMERTKSLFWAQFAAAVVSLVSIYPLIAYLGIIGVMIGNLSIIVTRFTIMMLTFRQSLRQVDEAAEERSP